MDTLTKLEILTDGAAKEEEPQAQAVSAAPGCFSPQRITDPRSRHRNPAGPGRFLPGGIQTSALPGGGSTRLLKVLQTNICEFDCFYCEHRASRDVPRTYVSPEEMARTFMMLHRKKLVDGLFLSSGITRKVDTMQERMVQTAEILRGRYAFKGYIHLKILPGASHAAVELSAQLADRLSLNLEAPTPQHLSRLSQRKDFLDAMLTRMAWVQRLQQDRPALIPAGQITQFVVGAAGETDGHILKASDHLYRRMGLRRAYYSAFSPVPDTPLDALRPTPLLRQHRLYQADWLLRFYGFQLDEVPLAPDGNLVLEVDPKTAWALSHPERFPLEIQKAPYEALIRVPGIGPLSAKKILQARRDHILRDPKDLKQLGVPGKRALPFLLLNGRHYPDQRPAAHQLSLWGNALV